MKTQIKDWLARGREIGKDFLLVVIDGYNGEHYPVYTDAKDLQAHLAKYNEKGSMQTVKICYVVGTGAELAVIPDKFKERLIELIISEVDKVLEENAKLTAELKGVTELVVAGKITKRLQANFHKTQKRLYEFNGQLNALNKVMKFVKHER